MRVDPEFAAAAAPLDHVDVDWIADPPTVLRRAYDAARERVAGDADPAVAVSPFTVDGASGLTFSPPGAPADRAVAYFHGGGWVVGSPETHRVLTSRLAAATGATVQSFRYRLGPENPWPAQREDAAAALRALLGGALGPAPTRVVIAGDSAGAAMAFWADAALSAAERASVAGVLGIYGAYGPLAETDAAADPAPDAPEDDSLSPAALDAYLRRLGPPEALARDPHFPIIERVDGAGAPVYLAAGWADPLVGRSIALHRRLGALGRPSTLDVAEGLPHSYMHFTERSKAARAALERAATWVRGRLDA